MSAFAACQITDALVELSYPELPGLDGSSLGFFNALSDAGFQEIGTREVADIYSRLFVQNDQIKIAVGKGTGHWRFDFVTDARWPGEMTFESLDILREYQSEVAPARTTVFSDEIDQVKAAGLGRGLDESSVLIIGESGYENNARFKDEPARHKLLDLIGDLYLSGIPIELLNVVGYRSGHRRNIEMAKLIFDSCQTP
jgi:UDP-3-O-acyl-N-acetylglucosamine deacetylase